MRSEQGMVQVTDRQAVEETTVEVSLEDSSYAGEGIQGIRGKGKLSFVVGLYEFSIEVEAVSFVFVFCPSTYVISRLWHR